MSRILIIGNSPAAISAVEEIRRLDGAAELALFCPEGFLPYNRGLLPAIVAKDSRESHIFLRPEKFAQEYKVQLVPNETLVRISLKRRQITTESKTHISFDKLLLTDLAMVKLPAIKGNHKTGVFNGVLLKSVRELIKYLPFADNIIVPVTNFAGFDMACALSRLGKQVVIIVNAGGLLNEILDDETSGLLKQIVEARGMRVVNESLVEILGDAEVKAVRFNSGKVMAAEAVIFDQVSPDLKLLAESEIMSPEGILVDAFFRTDIPQVFACDAVLHGYPLSLEESLEQGRAAGANVINGGAMTYQAPFIFREFGHKVCDGFLGGYIRLQEGGRERMTFDGPANIYKKIFLVNDKLVGAVWFNALQDKGRIQDALVKRLSLAGREDEFL